MLLLVPVLGIILNVWRKLRINVENNTRDIHKLKISQAVHDTVVTEIDKKQDKMDLKLDKIVEKLSNKVL
jgi:hypothetical protein